VVDLVAFAFDVESEGAVLSLNVALQVVVVGEFELGVEHDLDWAVAIRWHHTTHW